MTKRKKVEVEPKPTPPVAIDKSERLARDAFAVAVAHIADGGTAQGAFVRMGEVLACPICGTARSSDVCPVDGHRFEVT